MINLKKTILGTAVILAASLQLSAAATYNINVPDGFTSIPTGKVSGPSGAVIPATATIVKGGTGSLELAADSSTTCLAKFKINSGTLGLHNAMTNPIEFAGSESTATNTLKSLLVGGATGSVTHTIPVATIGSTATAIFQPASGVNVTITSLLGSGGATPAVGNMTVNGAGSTVSVASALPAGPGSYTVTSGTLKLSATAAPSSATGSISIGAAGTLDCSSSNAALPSGGLTIASGATLILGSGDFRGNITFN